MPIPESHGVCVYVAGLTPNQTQTAVTVFNASYLISHDMHIVRFDTWKVSVRPAALDAKL